MEINPSTYAPSALQGPMKDLKQFAPGENFLAEKPQELGPGTEGFALPKTGEATGESGGNVLADMISAVDARDKAAQAERKAFLSGESSNLHQAIIAGQEASLAFSLMVEMRNKVLEAYQELMRIQI